MVSARLVDCPDSPEEEDMHASNYRHDVCSWRGTCRDSLDICYQGSLKRRRSMKRGSDLLENQLVEVVIKMEYRKTVKDTEICIKYACLAILESVLFPTSLKMKIAREHAEAIKDLDAFFAFPWGRLAFDMLMELLVMVEAIPALTEVVQDTCSSSESDSEDIDGHGRDMFTKKQTLNPAHGRSVDKRSDVIVRSVLLEDPFRPIEGENLVWSDEEHDDKVESMLHRLNSNSNFTTSNFRGGIRKHDVDRMRESCKSTSKAKKAKNVGCTSHDLDPCSIASLVIDKIEPQFDVMETNIKDMVSALCKEQVVDRNGTHHIPTPGVDEVSVPANHTTHNPDANANTIRNVLCNDENFTPRKEDDVGSRYVPFDPVSDTCAPSAHSETSTRKNAFQRSLGNGAQHRQPLMITDEPTFSLGLTQEEQIQPDAHVMATEVGRGEPMSDNNGDDNIEEGQGSRKSKRKKTVPSGLLDDY
ncbi:hypothetical protein F2Q69_00055774 [Brassica cretica]|uniref:DUF1985 domain-containing protein n=1 Tax=Brassica cretica TaxID=69181 RepID=A0A8S9MVH3_BRACR|nr:hypothetical protein F2Q69_00055774 [Brassica cretica]